ncbi:MAG: pentapeptide repeat-containing protein [Lachnospiraceae bacterium]|nr:pentapeptide repeat-containing protein [Lachnospiraceae bacterium]
MSREEFLKNEFIGLRNATLKKMLEVYAEEQDSFLAAVSYKLSRILEMVRKVQEMEDIPIKCIHLSLMRYSVLKGTPVIRIDVYGERGVLSEAIITEEMPVRWAIVGLEELREKLLLKVEEYDTLLLGDVDICMSKTVDWIIHIFKENLRYQWKMAEKLKELKDIKKEKDFYISVGEYMDKQEYIYVERAPLDIFFNVDGETLIYRKYIKSIYTKKEFRRLELEGARFIDCAFRDSVFQNSSLVDCTFENCDFKKTVFDNCDIRGCEFINCTFQKVEYVKVDGNAYSGYKGFACRHLKYDNCDMKQVSYIECDISNANIYETRIRQVRVDNKSIVQNSDFAEYITNEEEENASV